MYAMAPPFPSLAGAPPLTHSNISFRLPVELAHVRHDDGLSAQTILGMRPMSRTAPSDGEGSREAFAMLRSGKTAPWQFINCTVIFTGRL
jgi:hypothetical protein